jgi:hypothetical protein
MPPVCHIGAVFLRALTGILGIIASSLQMVKRKAMTGVVGRKQSWELQASHELEE